MLTCLDLIFCRDHRVYIISGNIVAVLLFSPNSRVRHVRSNYGAKTPGMKQNHYDASCAVLYVSSLEKKRIAKSHEPWFIIYKLLYKTSSGMKFVTLYATRKSCSSIIISILLNLILKSFITSTKL